MNKTADTILYCTTSCGVNADPADGFGYCTCGTQEAKQSLMNDILALVGEDWNPEHDDTCRVVQEYIEELRQKIRHYFGQDNQEGK